jgi:hypothetical protein
VAREALEVVRRGRGLCVLVRVVTGHTVERISTLNEAATLLQPLGLETEPAGIVGLAMESLRLGDVMTTAAKLIDSSSTATTGVHDRQVMKAGLRGEHMIATRAVAGLASNRAVGRFGTDAVLDGSKVGRVAEQTSPLAVDGKGRGTEKVFRIRRMGIETGREIPPFPPRRIIIGDSHHARLTVIVLADE